MIPMPTANNVAITGNTAGMGGGMGQLAPNMMMAQLQQAPQGPAQANIPGMQLGSPTMGAMNPAMISTQPPSLPMNPFALGQGIQGALQARVPGAQIPQVPGVPGLPQLPQGPTSNMLQNLRAFAQMANPQLAGRIQGM